MRRREIGLRGMRLRAVEGGDGRTIEGVAVPFGDIIDTWEGAETFDRDCVFEDIENAKLCYQHGELIGGITGHESRDDGLHITARIADTSLGRDVTALLDEGALDSLSVGFIPMESERDKAGITHRKRVRLLETSLVSWPAYENAKLTGHRSETNTSHQENESEEPRMGDIEEIRNRQDDMAEQLRKIMANLDEPGRRQTTPGMNYRSYGELLKRLASGDDQARDDYQDIIRRDYSGGLLAGSDPQPVWIDRTLKILTDKRRITNLITHEALPAEGQTLTYPIVTEDTTKVARQEKEGDYLPYGEIKIGNRTANIETYGGYVSLSRQAIERATIAYLDTTLRALVNAYAKNTEAATRLALYGAIGDVADADKLDAGKTVDAMKPNDWLDIIIDAQLEIETRNASLSFLGVSEDVFKSIAHLTDSGDRFMDVSGSGVDRLGGIDVTSVSGNLLRIPVVLLPGAAANTAAFLDKEAVTMWESGSAPFQLQDENILNLTKDFSVYGYAAYGVTAPESILPVKFATA